MATSWLDSKPIATNSLAVAIPCSGSAMTATQVRRAFGTNAIFPTRSQQRTAKLDY